MLWRKQRTAQRDRPFVTWYTLQKPPVTGCGRPSALSAGEPLLSCSSEKQLAGFWIASW